MKNQKINASFVGPGSASPRPLCGKPLYQGRVDNLFNLKFMKIKCFVGVEYLIEELVFN